MVKNKIFFVVLFNTYLIHSRRSKLYHYKMDKNITIIKTALWVLDERCGMISWLTSRPKPELVFEKQELESL